MKLTPESSVNYDPFLRISSAAISMTTFSSGSTEILDGEIGRSGLFLDMALTLPTSISRYNDVDGVIDPNPTTLTTDFLLDYDLLIGPGWYFQLPFGFSIITGLGLHIEYIVGSYNEDFLALFGFGVASKTVLNYQLTDTFGIKAGVKLGYDRLTINASYDTSTYGILAEGQLAISPEIGLFFSKTIGSETSSNGTNGTNSTISPIRPKTKTKKPSR
jgi:hypothetical protein